MDLSKEEIFRMIEEYKKHRLLWDPEHKGYFNKWAKKNAWEAVGEAVGVKDEDAKRKMSSLLGSFRREKAKGKRINAGDPHKTYESDWFAFKHFSFLLESDEQEIPIEDQTSSVSNEGFFQFENIIVPKVETITEDIEEVHIIDTADSYSMPELTAAPFAKPPKPNRKRSRSSIAESACDDSHLKNGYDSTELMSIVNERRDSTAKFARYLESKLNQYNATTNAILIHKINQLLFEADMNIISNPRSTLSMATASPRSCVTPSPPPTHLPGNKKNQ